MKVIIYIFFLLGASLQSQALVDTKSANYTKTFVDIALTGTGLPLMIERTYNSRSLYQGMFGYGWCSNLETRLEVMPDNTLMVVECGGGAEISYTSGGAKGNPNGTIGQIMAEVKKKKGLSNKYIQQVEKDLKRSSLLQSELIRAFGLKGKAQRGKTYHAVGRQNDTITFNGNQYRRLRPNGHVEVFNAKGELIQELDKSGNWIRIQRKKGRIAKVIDAKGQALNFRWKKGRLVVTGPKKLKAEYKISPENNLTLAIDSKGDKYQYVYDNHHNLRKTKYSNNTYEALTYNIDKDWVTSFRDRRGCKEKYSYKTNSKNKDHYWTEVTKKCGKRVTNQSRYEFWNRKKADGNKYLYRARQSVNGRISDITYDGKTGSPLSVTRNGTTTRYAYYENGFLKSRTEARRRTLFSKYDGKCKKPNRVIVQNLQGKKVTNQVQTELSYDPKKCHLMMAKQNKTGRWVVVKRDRLGRIAEMRDQSKKVILVAYNEQHSKPRKITRPGVGSIQIFYDKNGQVDTKKTSTNPTVAAQVANVFNGFLEIISPVAVNMAI